MNKELFYKKMQPYFDQGIVREIYSSDYVCMLSVGERVYVACPYLLVGNDPYGIIMIPKVMKGIVEQNRKLFPLINEVFKDISSSKELLFVFAPERIDFWKKWIAENKNMNEIDYQLEEEIAQMSKSKSK